LTPTDWIISQGIELSSTTRRSPTPVHAPSSRPLLLHLEAIEVEIHALELASSFWSSSASSLPPEPSA
jgi:hypothetical protein